MNDTRPAGAVLADLPTVRPWQEDFYRDLHQHPELSHQEHRTAGAVAARLRDAGYDVVERVGGTGVVGTLRNGDGKAVLLRADMDALPVLEATGLPYASTDSATDATGTHVPVMHACGHDVHVTCLLGAATLLALHRDEWAGTLVALFQLVTSPIASHMVGRASFRGGHISSDLVVDELTDVLSPREETGPS